MTSGILPWLSVELLAKLLNLRFYFYVFNIAYILEENVKWPNFFLLIKRTVPRGFATEI